MRCKSVWIAIALVGTTLAIGGRAVSQSQVEKIMRQKLEHSQEVLEGLALEDFPKIAKNARAMVALSQAASWRVYQTPEYVQFSSEFQRLAQRLEQQANEKNIDGAALAYVQLTINCVNCHKHVRTVRAASLDKAPDLLR